ncbi:MAG TPA: sugar phosphate isomerase/epimerase [Bacteroidales bacterium]|jgi:sugar phosphate isomerase/epimerase|nr:TIM barrel protein [Bacteroidales bacterium]HNR42543.1 sugar phosphate isomerase/epimerase [Bacteroidales bacterium]HPM18820.1 sugar phosphate isomerase/epimerase [Bacteroidales bacterium]HPV15894.1 sugar phosphate isomerase/epimerase [Bacteroidales bacterium]HQG78109.1 sugar phosphate isomerase/epimerase [Bacteroidales bacterium]
MKNSRSRREFLRLSAAGALGALALSQYSCRNSPGTAGKASAAKSDPKSFGIGLQLYTIRDAMATDVRGSLKQVSDAGYKYVELANYADGKFYGYEPAEFLKIVNDLGMEILSSHTQVEAQGVTLDNAKKMAEDHARLGVKYCIQPWVVEEARKTIDSYRKMVADWNIVGGIMKEHGIMFGYHNHNFEFDTVEGKIPYFDVMLAELDKDLVTMEIDIFWATKAGQDPVEIFRKYPGRFQLFHMKDMFTKEAPFYTTDGVNDFAPVGAGVIDFRSILAAKDVAGMKYMIVEQDRSREGKPFDDIRTSIANLTTKILV